MQPEYKKHIKKVYVPEPEDDKYFYFVALWSNDDHIEKCVEYWRDIYQGNFMEYISDFEDDLYWK